VADSNHKDSKSNSGFEATAYNGGGEPNAGVNELKDALGNGRIPPEDHKVISMRVTPNRVCTEALSGASDMDDVF
jgi:hypothetical protein